MGPRGGRRSAPDQLARCRTGSPAEESRAVRRRPLGPCASLFTKSGSSGGRGGGVEDGAGGIGLGHRKKTGNDHYGRKAENLEA